MSKQAKVNQSTSKSTKYNQSFDDSRREETSDSGLGPTDLDVSRDSKVMIMISIIIISSGIVIIS